MIVRDPSRFAIESEIVDAYERLSLRALGSFMIHVAGCRFGVPDLKATMLACSFEAVQRRLTNRGKHEASFATESAAGIADAFRGAHYSEAPSASYFEIPLAYFQESFYSADLIWAPDGDQAFDDGSYVLQFDVGDQVRLVAFRSVVGNVHHPGTLAEVWLPAAEFYVALEQWRDRFESEWASSPKKELIT